MGWAIRLARRVEELHRLGVAHGGISAECVLTDASVRTAKGSLADVRSSPTVPAYHCPERHAGAGISPADDTWAVAVLLYFLLTGAVPFPGESATQVKARIAAGPPQPLAAFGRGDATLQAVLDAHLTPDVLRRAPRVAGLRQALEGWRPAAQLAALPPLDEVAAETSGDTFDSYDSGGGGDDDEDEDVATVMRDFTDIRKELTDQKATRPLPAAGMPALRPQPAPPQPHPPGQQLGLMRPFAGPAAQVAAPAAPGSGGPMLQPRVQKTLVLGQAGGINAPIAAQPGGVRRAGDSAQLPRPPLPPSTPRPPTPPASARPVVTTPMPRVAEPPVSARPVISIGAPPVTTRGLAPPAPPPAQGQPLPAAVVAAGGGSDDDDNDSALATVVMAGESADALQAEVDAALAAQGRSRPGPAAGRPAAPLPMPGPPPARMPAPAPAHGPYGGMQPPAMPPPTFQQMPATPGPGSGAAPGAPFGGMASPARAPEREDPATSPVLPAYGRELFAQRSTPLPPIGLGSPSAAPARPFAQPSPPQGAPSPFGPPPNSPAPGMGAQGAQPSFAPAAGSGPAAPPAWPGAGGQMPGPPGARDGADRTELDIANERALRIWLAIAIAVLVLTVTAVVVLWLRRQGIITLPF